MIKKLTPYLYFNGTAEAAMDFYAQVLGGEKTGVMRHGDVPGASEEYKDRIMHASLRHNAFELYFSDTSDKNEVKRGDNVSLTLEFESEESIDKVYKALSEGGSIYMELQKTFWNAKYAKLTDKFGVSWDLNYQYK